MEEIKLPGSFIKQDIKTTPLSQEDVAYIHSLSGSYEGVFSKRARLYKERNLKEAGLAEEDFKNLILEHYTFLKRPVLINNTEIFIGNSKKVVEASFMA
jgi:arsenate reductase